MSISKTVSCSSEWELHVFRSVKQRWHSHGLMNYHYIRCTSTHTTGAHLITAIMVFAIYYTAVKHLAQWYSQCLKCMFIEYLSPIDLCKKAFSQIYDIYSGVQNKLDLFSGKLNISFTTFLFTVNLVHGCKLYIKLTLFLSLLQIYKWSSCEIIFFDNYIG